MTDEEIEEWADRIFMNGEHIRIDQTHRRLVNALLPKVNDDPDAAAHVIAALLQQNVS